MATRPYTDIFNTQYRLPDGMPSTPTGPLTGLMKTLYEFGTHAKIPFASLFSRPACLVPVTFARETTADGATAYSLVFKLPINARVVAIDHGCLSAGGASATAMLQASTDSGSNWSDVQTAATDIKTGAGTPTRVAPLDTQDEHAADTWFRVKLVNGAGAALTGYAGVVWLQYL